MKFSPEILFNKPHTVVKIWRETYCNCSLMLVFLVYCPFHSHSIKTSISLFSYPLQLPFLFLIPLPPSRSLLSLALPSSSTLFLILPPSSSTPSSSLLFSQTFPSSLFPPDLTFLLPLSSSISSLDVPAYYTFSSSLFPTLFTLPQCILLSYPAPPLPPSPVFPSLLHPPGGCWWPLDTDKNLCWCNVVSGTTRGPHLRL